MYETPSVSNVICVTLSGNLLQIRLRNCGPVPNDSAICYAAGHPEKADTVLTSSLGLAEFLNFKLGLSFSNRTSSSRVQ